MWTYAGPNRTDPIAQDDGQTIFTMIAKVEDHGSGLRFWVELRGFEPLTPSMRMRMGHSNGFRPTSRFRVKCQLECQLAMPECVTRKRPLTRSASDK
jgi:hypothetical protein